ncbi:ATP-binding protein [Nitrospiraceae bacterium AH_259_D15_M11_P09]|nr:ATP-binding protein [Nitrospiraceae bacterium AH_259_D15_M11_P09]
MESTKPRKSIQRTAITYLILVGLVPLMIGGGLVYFYGLRSARNTIGTSFQDLAVETAHRVDQVLDAEIQRTRQLASVPILIRQEAMKASRRYEGMPREGIRTELARNEEAWANGNFPYQDVLTSDTARFLIESKEVAGDRIMGILVTDSRGAVVAATSQPKRFTHDQEAWWEGAQDPAGGFLYISDIVDAGNGTFVSQGDTLDIAVPIMDVTHTRVVGVLKICYRFDNLLALINKVRVGQTGHAMLFASDGTPLMCPILPRKAHRMDVGLLRMIVSEKPGWAVAEDDGHGAKGTVVGFAPLEGLKSLRSERLGSKTWHLFVRQLPSESFAPLHDLLLKVGGIGILLVGVLAVLGKYVGKRLVRPIQSLREGVEAIQQGDLSYRLSVKTGNELETLAEAVNTMAAGLQASKAELESCNQSLAVRVAEQTKELSDQVLRMDAILGNMAEGLVILNSKGEVEFMNPTARVLYGDCIGMRCAELFYGRTEPCTESDHACPTSECPKEALLSGRCQIHQFETRDQHGRVLQITMVPTASEAGEGLVVVLLRDVTQEAKLKRQLQLADKLATMGKMAAGIAHEINNPLGIIINRIECIERETRNQDIPTRLVGDLNSIKNHASRIARITKSLLACSRDSAMALKPFDINALVRDALVLVRERLTKLQAMCTLELSDDLPLVVGDKDQLETVVLNLLNNAIDALPPMRGMVSVRTRRASVEENGRVEITVSDNGNGIPADALDKVFDPFFTTKPAGRGTGLGLFLSYGIVKEHKGEITVTPNDGVGTTFVVTLPTHEVRGREVQRWTVRS